MQKDLSLAAHALSHKPAKKEGKAKKSKGKVREVRMRRGQSGGYIGENHMEDGQMQEHALPDEQAMLDHMSQNMGGGQPPENESAEAGAQPQAGMEPGQDA